MVVKNEVIVGYGEIGSSLMRVIGDCMVQDLGLGLSVTTSGSVNVLHICIPYTNKFISQVKEYQQDYRPELTIIYSTVPIGTTKEIGGNTVHSPIEGKHPNLHHGIEMVRFIGADNIKAGQEALKYWERYSSYVRVLESSTYTEAIKLLSTATYGINIVWADYMQRVAEAIDMPYKYIKDFNVSYNDIYANDRNINRYILDPPEGYIGGHCVVPNAKLLEDQYPNDWLQAIIHMGGDNAV